jgi:prevent-host-death family protein
MASIGRANVQRTGVAELKASLSEVLAKVKAGQEVTITDRGKPIARLTAIAGVAVGEAMEGLARQGLVRLPKRKLPEGFARRPRPADKKGALLRALLEEREASR